MALKLGELKSPEGSTRNRKRLGRGPGSGTGGTSGKGHKGHQARSGYRRKAYHEGGQMPLIRKLPKRGFHNPGRVSYQTVNLRRLAKVAESEITMDVALATKLLSSRGKPYKILGDGEIDRAVVVHAHAFSKTAREKIERAGGRCEVIA
jgi:large subunit ribosomal protein L15